MLQDCFVSGTGRGLDKQAGASGLLLAKRSFGLVVALLTSNTVILSLHPSLEATSALVMQGVVLGLVLVASTLLAFFLVEANAQVIFCIELRRNAQNIRVARRGRTVALPPVALLPVVAGLAHRVTKLLISCFTKKILNPGPV